MKSNNNKAITNYGFDIGSETHFVPKNVEENAMSYKGKSTSVAGNCVFRDGLGSLRQQIQVFAVGKKES